MSELPMMPLADADNYGKSGYWNDLPTVAAEINLRISGDPHCGVVQFFASTRGRRIFSRVLFLNCGSGWVEREFFQAKLFSKAVGIECSAALLDQARRANEALPIQYFQMDINAGELPDGPFDLVVNYAAAHKIERLDRVFREVCRRMTRGGILINYDYIGPHRNQYPWEQWSKVWEVNRRLPPSARQVLAYPHLPTMLVTDPSEAVHSELTLALLQRYFRITMFRPVGGAVAYPLLTFNEALFALPAEQRDSLANEVMAADWAFYCQNPNSALFAYWVAKPKHSALRAKSRVVAFSREEADREEQARARGGRYYSQTLLQSLSDADDSWDLDGKMPAHPPIALPPRSPIREGLRSRPVTARTLGISAAALLVAVATLIYPLAALILSGAALAFVCRSIDSNGTGKESEPS